MMKRLTSLNSSLTGYQVIYHGIFAFRSTWRYQVLPFDKKGMKEKSLAKRLLRLSKRKEMGDTDDFLHDFELVFCTP